MAKEKSPRERPPRCCVFRPSMDEKSVRAGRACRRAIPGAAASGRNPLRPPCGPDRPALTAAQGPRKSFASMPAIVASLEARPNELLRSLTRARCAPNGAPRTRRADDGRVRRMAHRRCASSPPAQGGAVGEPRRPHAHPEHTDVLGTCSRVAFLWPRKERWHARRDAGGKDKDVKRYSDDVVLPPDEAASAAPAAPGGHFTCDTIHFTVASTCASESAGLPPLAGMWLPSGPV